MRVLVVAAAMSVLAGCGTGADSSLAQADPEVPQFAGPDECNDTFSGSVPPTASGPAQGSPAAACAAGFTLEGTFYALSCGAVRPETVTGDVIAEGVYSGVRTEMRRIADVAPELLVAIRLDGGYCGEGDKVLSPWSMAFPGDAAGRPETTDAICRVGFKEHAARNRCTRSRA